SMYEHFDKQAKMGAKVRGALAYPMFVMAVAIVVVVVLMIVVVPTFLELFREFDAELPLITRMLIAVSDFFRQNGILLGLVMFLLFMAFQLYDRTPEGHINLGKIQLKIPVLGNIATLNAASQFANSMTTLIESGLPMTRAVNITSRVMDNAYLSAEVGKLSGEVEAGRSLGASMRAQAVMPNILVDMTAIGEASGELAKTLHTVARFYDAELDQAILSALAKMEPALLVFLGGIAAFIVLAVYLAMFTLYAAM
ncbi:MAG: type II secretion system F family protein, partial [Oscillibacter sp.]|nr:type II secretion system F family protein [Oscillibacter sp.]